jgi:UDP-N-acetylmuramyl pentapeptide synthase
MLELGEASPAEHKGILELVKSFGFEKALFVGREFEAAGAKPVYEDIEELKKALEADPLEGKTILIKGSHGIKLEQLNDYKRL